MDKEELVGEVKEVVDNGVAPAEKEVESVVEKKDDEKDTEDSKDEEEKTETLKMDVDNEETGEHDKTEEIKEVEEVKSAEVEDENATNPEEGEKDKVESAPGLSTDDKKADKDAEKKISRKKSGKEKPKAAAQSPKEKKAGDKEKEEPKTPVTPASNRPVRERKSVERLVATVEKDSGKDFRIEKGPGTALKDIPNVAYKLSRKKSEETFKLLHTILFGRRGKAPQVKSNISQFSGFVWHGNEDKQKDKIKEKLDKCVKEKLLEFCDLFDLPITRATSKKEDIVTKLFEFLEAPHATTSDLLADKEQSSKGTKRKRSSKKSTSPSGSAPSKNSSKSRKMNGNASKGEEKKDTPEMEDEHEQAGDDDVHGEQENVNGVSDTDDEKPELAKSKENESDAEVGSEEETKKRKRVPSKKSSVKKDSAEKAKTKKPTTVKKSSPPPKKASSKPSSSRSKVPDSDPSPKIFSRKKKTEVVKEKSPTPKKSASKEKSGKKVVKGKDKPKVEKVMPSDNELKNAIREILKEVDFNTATFTDILKLLGERFNTDLAPKKTSIKGMIQEELTKLAEEADSEEDDESEAVKADKPASAAGVDV